MMALPYLVLSALRKALYPAENGAVMAEEGFKPFDLSCLQHLPRENDRPAVDEVRRVQVQAVYRPAVQPPAVPFNYPNA